MSKTKTKLKQKIKQYIPLAVVLSAFAGILVVNMVPSLNFNLSEDDQQAIARLQTEVLPAKGLNTGIVLGDAIPKLVESGVIDIKKFEALYASRGGFTAEQKRLLTQPSNEPMVFTAESSRVLLNMLWPLGLANKTQINEQSPINGRNKDRFASTGGWRLGKASKGGEYFNKFEIVKLTPQQEALVLRVSKSIFRPCCNNSTFFQDCNHGSAMLGLLELGAAQGLSEEQLYRAAVAASSFWFPSNYLKTALYFEKVEGVKWKNVDPSLVMSRKFSSASGWGKNVNEELRNRSLLPQIPRSGGSCGA